MKIAWKRRALLDLDRIAAHIAEDDPSAARRVVRRVREAVEILERQPYAGRIGRVEQTRELVVSSLPYTLAYQLHPEADEIEILAVFHHRQEWPDELGGG